MAKRPFSKRLLADVLQGMWEVYCSGEETDVAAGAVGITRKTAFNWIRDEGGVRPRRGLNLQGGRLSFDERLRIAEGLAVGESLRSIGAGLERAPSTISREVKRGRTAAGKYSATLAHERAHENAGRPKTCKLGQNTALRERVEADLAQRYSPEQIAGRLAQDFPDNPEMQVHHETIYRTLYVQSRGVLRAELAACLRSGRIRRKPHRQSAERRGRIPDMMMIADRPEEVDERVVPGHWEGDLILGKNNRSAIGTLVERTTNYTLLLHLPNGHGAEQVTAALVAAVKDLPDQLRRSITWDQGKEMAGHKDVKVAAALEVYFCDPHAPWQRPVNENTNGLLRQYFPKGSDLNAHSRDDLDWVAHQLNDRPRKRLDYARPSELIGELLLR